MYSIKPELIGIYNNGVATSGGGGGGSAGPSITVPAATLTTPGVVVTCNSSSGSVTSDTVNVVPTQYYVQSEIARLENAISSAGAIQYTPISSSTID